MLVTTSDYEQSDRTLEVKTQHYTITWNENRKEYRLHFTDCNNFTDRYHAFAWYLDSDALDHVNAVRLLVARHYASDKAAAVTDAIIARFWGMPQMPEKRKMMVEAIKAYNVLHLLGL